MRWRAIRLLLACAVVAGCARDDAWRRAEALWHARAPEAFAAWRALDPATPAGARAHQRLRAADEKYRRGIELFAAGQIVDARSLLAAAADEAPMDPARYLALARAARDRGLTARAADFYQKLLAARPPGVDTAAAARELAALDDGGIDAIFATPPTPMWPIAAAVALVVVAAALVGVVVARRRRRGHSLAELARANPELQPAITFLVGCLRHELLKHRILALGDGARALAEGGAAPGMREFLLVRLYGGEPLRVAWAGHLGAFMRALGPRFDLVRFDPVFRAADRALAALAADEAALRRDDAEAWARLGRAQAELAAFDAALAALTAQLAHSRLDAALLSEVVADVRRELGPHAAVDAIEVLEVAPDVAVEMFRHDLVLVLKNVVRNAVAAAAAGPSPRRVAVDVTTAVEATGEEIVRVRVRDTHPAELPAAAPPTRGLGLVTTVLARYDGAIAVEPADGGYAKAVVVRLFRALAAVEEAA